MSRCFDGPLVIEFDRKASDLLGGAYWRVKRSFRFYLPASHIGNEWVEYQSNRWAYVPAGMLTDLGSIPKVFRGIIDVGGAAAQAYVLHDQLCEYLSITADGKPESISRREADLILRDALLDLEIDKTTTHLIHEAVAAYQLAKGITRPSTTALKRRLEAEYNFEGLN
ncbi:MAG TPA: DUF1353 domain-containing protein [Pyrinomonadaceae bacterium]|nr:DUF1353 domain-containing protein [Pyrinomonadaceae bacterium]